MMQSDFVFVAPMLLMLINKTFFFLRPFSSERTYYCLTCRVNTTLKEPRGRMRRKCGVSSDCVFDVDSHLHRIWQGQTGQAVSNGHVEF